LVRGELTDPQVVAVGQETEVGDRVGLRVVPTQQDRGKQSVPLQLAVRAQSLGGQFSPRAQVACAPCPDQQIQQRVETRPLRAIEVVRPDRERTTSGML